MRSTLIVTDDAGDLSLLSVEELRTAAGITGSSQDVALKAMGLRCASAIMTYCKIAVAPGFAPTLKQEGLVETFYQTHDSDLILARRHDIIMSSLVVNGTELVADTDYILDPESGVLSRMSNDRPIDWCASKVIATYQAGFETLPGDLKQAAMDFVNFAWREKDRDPALKSETVDIPDVIRTERAWWVGSVPGQAKEGAVPDIVAGQLQRFCNYFVG